MKKKIKIYFSTNPNQVVNTKTLGKKLKIKKKEYEDFKASLHSLLKEGFLDRSGSRYKLNSGTKEKLIG